MKFLKKFSISLWSILFIFSCISCFEPKTIELITPDQQQRNINKSGIARDLVFYVKRYNDSFYKCYLNAENGTFKFYDKMTSSSNMSESDLKQSPKIPEVTGDFIYDGNYYFYLKTTSEIKNPDFSEYMSFYYDAVNNTIKELTIAPINEDLAVDAPLYLYSKDTYAYLIQIEEDK